MTALAAVVFDFDGTIIDTETPVYEAWRLTFEYYGVEPIPLDEWRASIGLADADARDVRAELREALGVIELPGEVDEYRRRCRDELLHALPIRPGIVEWHDHAADVGVAVAVASSSGTEWVEATCSGSDCVTASRF